MKINEATAKCTTLMNNVLTIESTWGPALVKLRGTNVSDGNANNAAATADNDSGAD